MPPVLLLMTSVLTCLSSRRSSLPFLLRADRRLLVLLHAAATTVVLRSLLCVTAVPHAQRRVRSAPHHRLDRRRCVAAARARDDRRAPQPRPPLVRAAADHALLGDAWCAHTRVSIRSHTPLFCTIRSPFSIAAQRRRFRRWPRRNVPKRSCRRCSLRIRTSLRGFVVYIAFCFLLGVLAHHN